MPSVFEQLLARINAVLESAALVPAGHVSRGRQEPYGEDELPAIKIVRGSTLTQGASFESDQVTLSFSLSIYVAGAAVETAADALHVSSHAVLFADPVLQSIGRRTLRLAGTDHDADDIDQPVYQLNCRYEIDAWVSRADLNQIT